MLSPSDFNNAVPQFTNGNYASNPLNPQYITEPSSTDYNRGVEPIQTLPAQWWNWFMNKFTTRFNKVNVYVKNIFNELSQLLSLVSETPSGTEGEPTIGQLKDMFETKYPDYLKTAPALSNTYVPKTTTVNGQALSGNVTVTCVACAGANGSGTAFGTAATLNTGTAAGCIPIVGTALGTTNGQFVATDANGCLKPSGYSASSFRASTWTPTCVACAGKVKRNGYTSAYCFDVALTNGCSTADGTDLYASCKCRIRFCSTTGVLYADCFCGQAYNARYACAAEQAVNADRAENAVSAVCSCYAEYACTHTSAIQHYGCGNYSFAGVCIWLANTSNYTMCITNNSDTPIMYYAAHNVGGSCSKLNGIISPGCSAGLGSCWNCCACTAKCVMVYFFA